MPDKISKLKELLKLVDESLTRQEFTDAFKEVIAFVKGAERGLQTRFDNELEKLAEESTKAVRDVTKQSDSILFAGVRRRAVLSINTLFEELNLNKKLETVVEKMTNEHRNKTVLMDAMIGEIPSKEEFLALIPKPVVPVKETAKEARDKLETLEGDERLDAKHIKGLEEKFKELNTRISSIPRGGGTSAIGVAHAFKYIAFTEAPTGAINGVNTTYTVKNNIWWIAGFTLNGEQVAELPNFTYANKTITFTAAIPAAYSGKDFEVKYIGT